jgi:hypothetical protein
MNVICSTMMLLLMVSLVHYDKAVNDSKILSKLMQMTGQTHCQSWCRTCACLRQPLPLVAPQFYVTIAAGVIPWNSCNALSCRMYQAIHFWSSTAVRIIIRSAHIGEEVGFSSDSALFLAVYEQQSIHTCNWFSFLMPDLHKPEGN